jgi:AmmeMemoRadiSam system protein B/AmmeMemoRadiSam system protein A
MKHIIKSYFVLLSICTSIAAEHVFDAHRAGSWYPKEPKHLTELLQRLSVEAKDVFAMDTDSAKIRALIAPHAGYTFSGKVASAVYNLIDPKTVTQIIILGPSHFVSFDGIAVPDFTRYRTPLGALTVNTAAVKKIKKHELAKSGEHYFKPEHSIEMQLPLIQRAAPKAKIIPIVVGHLDESQVKAVASLLQPYITKGTLIVVSTDFTHYGKTFRYVPFTKNIVRNINQLDSSVLQPIQHQNRSAFEAVIEETHDTMCGFHPERVLLELIKQNTFGTVATRLVSHGSSFDVAYDDQNIVSYAGLIVTNDVENDLLNKQEQTSLLTYSRAILKESFKPTLNPDLLKPILTPLLEKRQGAFTTLWTVDKTKERHLRGCIGEGHPDKPLYEIVAETTLDAAFRDTRFSPVTANELPNLQIQIAVLKEPRPVESYEEIVLNKHGIILRNGTKSALFLPTVPAEFGFDLTQTLEELSLKARLDKNAWKLPTTTFQVFEAQDFEEVH